MDIWDIMYIMYIMDIMDIMDIMIITAWMAMACAVLALVYATFPLSWSGLLPSL